MITKLTTKSNPMATIQFKGKSAVWNHHLSVPYHTLEEDKKKSLKGDNQSDNLIIQGDNLLALKSLLPMYQGKIKCIYIDPPYNTGNEGWVYNDKVNSPTIKEWFKQKVGKEGEDLTRHDKWLCMMMPRLKLLRELLAEDGAIFVSIDNHEVQHLKMIMDDVFGIENTISILAWKGKSGAEDDKYFRTVHEYILCFARNKDAFDAGKEVKTNERFPKYDKKKQRWYKTQLARKWGSNSRREDRPNLYYSIKAPDGSEVYPKLPNGKDGCWRWKKEKMTNEIDIGNIEFIKESKEWIVYEKKWQPTIEEGPSTKKFNTWLDDVGSTSNGTEQLNLLFEEGTFNHPKPTTLIVKLMKMAGIENDAIVLDSFAGSGTTAHAVMDLNKEDSGNRKFILVEMEDYANNITAERVRRAIKKNEYKAGFTYSTLGPAIDAESLLSGKLPTYQQFAKYVYYLATGKNLKDATKIKETTSFVGKGDNESIYLRYAPDMEKLKQLAVTLDWAQETHKKDNGRKIVYAPACYLDEESMERYNIEFVSIPYNLFERKA